MGKANRNTLRNFGRARKPTGLAARAASSAKKSKEEKSKEVPQPLKCGDDTQLPEVASKKLQAQDKDEIMPAEDFLSADDELDAAKTVPPSVRKGTAALVEEEPACEEGPAVQEKLQLDQPKTEGAVRSARKKNMKQVTLRLAVVKGEGAPVASGGAFVKEEVARGDEDMAEGAAAVESRSNRSLATKVEAEAVREDIPLAKEASSPEEEMETRQRLAKEEGALFPDMEDGPVRPSQKKKRKKQENLQFTVAKKEELPTSRNKLGPLHSPRRQRLTDWSQVLAADPNIVDVSDMSDDEKEAILRLFDLNPAYGPFSGLERDVRWKRALSTGKTPPLIIRKILDSGTGISSRWSMGLF